MRRDVVALAALVFAGGVAMAAHPPQDEEPGRRTVADEHVSGDFEFDLSDAGLGVLIVKFTVEDGVLWAQTQAASEPFPLEAVPETEARYSANHPDEGTYEVTFLRDEGGRFARARIVNQTLGIDAYGRRLDSPVVFQTLSERLASRDGLTETRGDLQGTRVAVFFGRGMDRNSAIALGRAFQWMGCDVEIVDSDDITSGCLLQFDVLAFPGGEKDPDPWGELGPEGVENIREFIRGGGGYIGVCFGALFASSSGEFWGQPVHQADRSPLDLFQGSARCGQNDIAPPGSWPLMTDLNVPDHSHPITETLPDRMHVVVYPNGPYLEPFAGAEVAVIATFDITGTPAMVAFEYGEGKVFLSGPHPEIEVDSERDGSGRFDKLADEGSEWPVLLAVVKWMVGEGTALSQPG